MLVAYPPLLVCLLGLLLYALSGNAKVSALGKDMFWIGLLVTMFSTTGHSVRLF